MMRRYAFYLLLLLLFLGGAIFVNQQQKEESLTPDLLNYATLEPLDPEYLERNLFTGLIGLILPESTYRESAKSLVLYNYNYLVDQHQNNAPIDFSRLLTIEDALGDRSPMQMRWLDAFTAEDFQGIFRCFRQEIDRELQENRTGCLTQLANYREEILGLIDLNQPLLSRYDALFNESDFYATIYYPYGEYRRLLDNNGYRLAELNQLSNLRLLEGALALMAGDTDTALAQFYEERRRLALFLADEPTAPSLFLLQLIEARMNGLYLFMNQLLNGGLLDGVLQDPRVQAIFAPFDRIERNAIQRAIAHEMDELIMPSLYPYLLSTQAEWEEARSPNAIQLSYAEREIAFEWLESRLGRDILGVSYGGKRATNQFKLRVKGEESTLKALRAALWSDHYLDQPERYFADKGITFIDLIHFFEIEISPLHLNEHYRYLRDYYHALINDPYGEERRLIERRGAEMGDLYDYSHYFKAIHSMDETLHRGALLLLKYRAYAEGISADEMERWLDEQGAIATSRITGKRFGWDREREMLSVERAPILIGLERADQSAVVTKSGKRASKRLALRLRFQS